jgi:potassium efflux system protein
MPRPHAQPRPSVVTAVLLALLLTLAAALPGLAQQTPPQQTPPQPGASSLGSAAPGTAAAGGGALPNRSWVPGSASNGGPDYAAWEVQARRVEQALADPRSSNLVLEQLRSRVVEWRTRFLAAQTANQARIETLRGQLRALGPVPEDGALEAPEIAERRAELNAQLARLQAPVVAADEAFRRADGLVREIDRTLRERQADALMQLSPAPLNPANWPGAWRDLGGVLRALGREAAVAWTTETRRAQLGDALPLIAAYLLVASVLLLRGRRLVETATERMRARAAARVQTILAMLASTTQVLVPFLGVLALVEALRATGMIGLRATPLVDTVPLAGLSLLLARWLGGQVFPRGDPDGEALLNLPPDRRREGRFHATALGLVLAAAQLTQALFQPVTVTEATTAVLTFPFLLLCGLLLFRLGQLMRRHMAAAGATPAYSDRLIGVGGRVVMVIGVTGPVLAGVGYVTGGTAMVYPAVLSLGLIALLMLVQRLIAESYAAALGGDPGLRDALIPTLAGFALVLVSMPVFALLWGVREADLREFWNAMREGFNVGETRISPTDFLTFALVFAIGYTITRLVQGALRNSVLPKTTIEKGAQTAVVSGLGYVGIFFAAMIAFGAAGIDLSNVALLAGALSVGIGFGLQTVVSNFVSGIILLFERPVAEGDWIEVGGVMGTVRKISVRSTVIETFDRTHVIVPNSDLISGQVTNWTRYNLTGRLIVKVSVAYGSDTKKVERLLHEIAEAQPLVSLNPPPGVIFMNFGANGLEFEVRMILRDVNFMLRVRSDVNHEIARRFAEEGIEIPFGQTDVWFRNPEEVARALRALPPQAAPPPEVPPAQGG